MPTRRQAAKKSDSGSRGEAARLARRLRALERENRALTARLAARDAELAILKADGGEALDESRNPFFTMADESPIMLWVYDAEDRPVFYNTAVLAFLGLDRDTALACDVHNLVHPEDRARVEALDRQAAETPKPFQNEYRLRRADGEYRWILDIGMPRLAADGTYLGSAGCCIDITERHLAQEALRDSEANLARAQKIARIGSWRWRAGPQPWASGSREFSRLLGLKRGAKITCQDLHRAVHGEDRRRVEDVHARAVRTASNYQIDYRICRPDGSIRHVQEIGEAHRDAAGRLIEHRGTLQDITERKEAEAALRQAKDDAELANKAKSDFLANMSHELRTPLNAVLGFTEIMNRELHGPLGHPAYADYVEDIHQSGRLLLELINDILDLAKVETGNATLDEVEVDIEAVLEACLRFVAERAKESGIALTPDLDGDGMALRADPRKIKQIVINLLSNAVKFTPSGGSVFLRCRTSQEDGCIIEISDTGVGMARGDIPKALDRFRQLDAGLTRRQEGTGLGLPLSKALTELHGGTIELRSKRGRGTTVTVRLPADRLVAPMAGKEIPVRLSTRKTDGFAPAG